MKKIILELDQNNGVYDDQGNLVGTLMGNCKDYEEDNTASTTLQLVKQGVTVDEIIKLKNADLL